MSRRNPNRSLYEVLDVAPDASADTLRKRYRALARELHPDANPDDPVAEERFKEVSHAYEVLSDVERRALYDEFGEISLTPGFDLEAARRAGPGFHFQSFAEGADLGGLEDLLGDLFGGGGFARRAAPVRGANLEASMEIDFETSMRGGTRLLTLKRPGTDGALAEERLRVEVPAGIAPGARLRLAGKGSPGPAGPGDLYVTILVAPHPVFTREDRHLTLELPISFREATLGAEVTVPTLDGRATLRVPPGSQPGRRLRLRGKGASASGGAPAGDLLVTLRVQVPRAPGEEERQAVEALAAFEPDDLREGLLPPFTRGGSGA